jgi:hypothetical protein
MADDGSEVEFFGARIKVKNPALAALLNSGMSDDVVVVGKRARDAFASDETASDAEGESGEVAEVIPIRPAGSESDES